MKNFLIILSCALSCVINGLAQSYAIVGSGTSSNNSTSYPCPLGNYYPGARHQLLVKATELTASGVTANSNIYSIGFNITATNSVANLQNWMVKVYTTTSTFSLSSGWQSANLVASSVPSTLNVAIGWTETPFSTPFLWNGTDNLIIETCFYNGTNSYNPAIQRTTNLTGGWHSRWGIGFNSNTCANTLSDDESNNTRPNIRLGFNNTACSGMPAPGNTIATAAYSCPSAPVSLSIQNINTAVGLTYHWQSSPDNINWSNIPGATTISSTQTAAVSTYFRCAVTCAGATSHTTPALINVPASLAGGIYTVNGTQPTAGNNFNTLAAFANACHSIGGPVVINIAPGTYNEPLLLDQVCGTSATNTITINGNGSLISYVSNSASEKGIVRLNNTDHVILNGLNIAGYTTSATNYAWGIYLTNDADSVTIKNCTITLDSNSTSWNYAGIVVTGPASPEDPGSTCDKIYIQNNLINGGYTGIALAGEYYPGYMEGGEITGNEIRNSSHFGLYLAETNGFKIDKNEIHRTTRSNPGYFRAIYAAGYGSGLRIRKNKIHDPGTGNPSTAFAFYGILLDEVSGWPDSIEVSNNLIYNTTGTGGHVYISADYTDPVNIYYNTIFSDSMTNIATGYTVGFTGDISQFGVTFKNNNIVLKRNTTGTKRCIYIGANASGFDNADYNNLYVSGSGNNFVGANDFPGETLSDWQNISPSDAHSISVDPAFANPTAGVLIPTLMSMNNAGTSYASWTSDNIPVTTDFIGNFRPFPTPDIGAFEFSPVMCTGAPTAGAASANTSSACPTAKVMLTVAGTPSIAGIIINWQQSLAGANAWADIPNSTVPNNTGYELSMPSVNSDFRAAVTCTYSGNISYSIPVTVSALPWYTCYCSPVTGTTLHDPSNAYNGITNVSIAGTTLNSTSTSMAGVGYTFFSPAVSANTATLTQLGQYTLNTQAFEYAAWIDFDHSGTFDSVEMLFSPYADPNTFIQNTTFYIPSNTQTGLTGLRVRLGNSWLYQTEGACTYDEYGVETEDYVVNIISGPPCSGTPSAGTITPTADSACIGQWLTLDLSGYPLQQNISFQWQQSIAGQNTWTDITGATNPNYIEWYLPDTMDYRVIVTCNGSNSDTSLPVTINLVPIFNCYPFVTNGGGNGTMINNVSFGSINNNTAVSNPTSAPYYNNYYVMTNGEKGTSMPLSVTIEPPATYTAANISAWIDFNRNGYYDYDEWLPMGTNIASGTTATINVNVPANAVTGLTGMRIRSTHSFETHNAYIANNSLNSGETEDYIVNIVQNPLAIKLTKIIATNMGGHNKINWTVAHTTVGDIFDLERSNDGKTFSWLSTTNANGVQGSYTYLDASPFDGINYYRLQMRSADGNQSYSNVVSAVVRNSSSFSVVAYPNPAKEIVSIKLNGIPGNHPFITICDISGKTLKKVQAEQNITTIDTRNLTPGLYLIRYTDDRYNQVLKLNKQ